MMTTERIAGCDERGKFRFHISINEGREYRHLLPVLVIIFRPGEEYMFDIALHAFYSVWALSFYWGRARGKRLSARRVRVSRNMVLMDRIWSRLTDREKRGLYLSNYDEFAEMEREFREVGKKKSPHKRNA